MNGRGGFRFPPAPRTRPMYPHELDMMRAQAMAARMQAGYAPHVPPREVSHIPNQGGGNPWDEDGSDRLPPPGWHQNPGSAEIRSVIPRTAENATVRWGDTKNLTLPIVAGGPQSEKANTYLLAVDLAMPAVGLLRLSVTSPDIVALNGAWTCDWMIQTGVGQSQFEELHRAPIAPANGTSPTTLSLTIPVHSLRVTAEVHVGPLTTAPRVSLCAQWAPYTAYPDLVRIISTMNKEPVTT